MKTRKRLVVMLAAIAIAIAAIALACHSPVSYPITGKIGIWGSAVFGTSLFGK